MTLDLTKDDQLKQAVDSINPLERNPDWLQGLEQLLTYVQNTGVESRNSKEFHVRIWENNAVTGVGMGTVDISGAIDDAGFRGWLAEESMKPLADSPEAKLAQFQSLYEEIMSRLKAFSNRTPHVKIFRVLAALYPKYFTTIANRRMALICHRALFGRRKRPDFVQRQVEIRERLDKILGPCGESPGELAERMTLAWYTFTDYVQPEDTSDDVEITDQSGEVAIKPLPALQRRKGFTSIKGGLGTIYSALGFVTDGVTREDLLDYLRAEFPDYRESSLRTTINILKNEFYVIQEVNGVISPTDRGELFLESRDPQELIPQFLARTLGVDHILLALAKELQTTGELIALLKKVNPGWTTDFAPRAMLKWLRDFGLMQVDNSSVYHLTESGKSWSEAIHWQPEFLEPMDSGEVDDPPLTETQLDIHKLNQGSLIEAVVADSAFVTHLVKQLHFGLWAHPRRHFAILAGLSGSGKTLLAQRYARSVAAQYIDNPEKNVFIQAVQPGWYDPAPLFGYINPLMPDNYIRPPLLDFLLQAATHPDQPFTVILDEMNLSHPEQYFAPVLSAMESGERLRLHNEGDSFDGVPSTIAYPANVAFIGTVNMDETTHGISDKVLDRAFTLEFWDVNLDEYPGWQVDGLNAADISTIKGCLAELLQSLAPERLHFGWRTVEDVLSYLALASQGNEFDLTAALDDVVYARVLPKLRGSESNRLHEALQQTITVLEKQGLSRSCAKVRTLKADLAETGMMRFWR
ncbi:MAG: hypothetical protein RPU64_16580 [Candidatus Sedimenticola sp. (ex Thyasira tokunagai)]